LSPSSNLAAIFPGTEGVTGAGRFGNGMTVPPPGAAGCGAAPGIGCGMGCGCGIGFGCGTGCGHGCGCGPGCGRGAGTGFGAPLIALAIKETNSAKSAINSCNINATPIAMKLATEVK